MIRSAAIVLLTLPFIAHSGTPPLQDKKEKIDLSVFAAASLNEAFQEIAKIFNKSNPSVAVEFSFAGSQQLVQQISEGAHADVFASADTKQMGIAVQSGLVDSGSVRTFAHNRLVIIVPKRESRIHSVRDLGMAGTTIILADKAVPVGRYSLQALDRISEDSTFGNNFKEGVLRNVVSYEENVRAVLAKIILAEADAGIVYATDLTGDRDRKLKTIDIPDTWNSLATYPIATVRSSRHHEAAERFMECVLSKAGQAVLRRLGFIEGAENIGSRE